MSVSRLTLKPFSYRDGTVNAKEEVKQNDEIGEHRSKIPGRVIRIDRRTGK
jgi:hypothetical protein